MLQRLSQSHFEKLRTKDGFFLNLSQQEQTDILKFDPPMAGTCAVFNENRKASYVQRMTTGYRKEWLCSSSTAIFCYPCTLFVEEKDRSGQFLIQGCSNRVQLSKELDRHEVKLCHRNSMRIYKDRKTRSEVPIEVALSTARKEQIARHNETVSHNRNMFAYNMQAVYFLTRQGLPLRGDDESAESHNKGNYRELLEVFADNNQVFNEHLKNPFPGTSCHTQGDIAISMCNVLKAEIASVIQDAQYLSIMADESIDISKKAQLALHIRVCKNNKLEEIFLGFRDCSTQRTAIDLAKIITSILDEFPTKAHLVGQSYDGASCMAGRIGGVQTLIRERFPTATFVHCYAHRVNLGVCEAIEGYDHASEFLRNLSHVSNFFTASSKRFSRIKFPGVCKTRWSSKARVVAFMSRNFKEVKEALIEMSTSSDDTGLKASALINIVSDRDFYVMLLIMKDVFDITDILQLNVQEKLIDVPSAQRCLNHTIDSLDLLLREKSEEKMRQYLITTKNLKSSKDFNDDEFAQLFVEIVSRTKSHLYNRFNDSLVNLFFIPLVDKKNFATYSKTFPEETIQRTKRMYPFLNIDILRTNLRYLYTCEQVDDVQKFALDNHLSALNELLKVIRTIPATSVPCERDFSAMKRLKTAKRTRLLQTNFETFAFLNVNGERFKSLYKRPEFRDHVVEHYAHMKDRKNAYLYK